MSPEWMAGTALFTVLAVAAVGFRSDAKGIRKRTLYINQYAFSEGLDEKLKAKLPTLSDEQRARVWQGLREFFLLVQSARGRPVAMPSRAVDDGMAPFRV